MYHYFPERKNYDLAREEIEKQLRELYTKSEICSAFLYGSYVIDEHVPGFSDLDVFVALPREKIEPEVYTALNLLSNTVTKEFDINCNYQVRGGRNLVDPFIAWLLGSYNIPIVGEEPKRVLNYEAVSQQYLENGEKFARKIVPKYISEVQKVLLQMGPERASFKNVPLPPSLIKKEVDYRIEMAALIIDRVLDISMYGNLLFDDFAYCRKEFVDKSITHFKGVISESNIISDCVHLRAEWGKNRLADLDELISGAPRYIEEIAAWMRTR